MGNDIAQCGQCGLTAPCAVICPSGRYWEMVERLRPTHFYGAPTALRLLLKHGDSWVTKSVSQSRTATSLT